MFPNLFGKTQAGLIFTQANNKWPTHEYYCKVTTREHPQKIVVDSNCYQIEKKKLRNKIKFKSTGKKSAHQ